MNRNICVFCASSNRLEAGFFDVAQQIGQRIASENDTLVYGGANVGLMRHTALAVKHGGGKIIGVIPERFKAKKLSDNLADKIIFTGSMHERKATMESYADAFVVLPGGFGTLEELLEVITLKQLDYHRKPIAIVNINGFYNRLLEQFGMFFELKFTKNTYKTLYYVAASADETFHYINNYETPKKVSKWHIV